MYSMIRSLTVRQLFFQQLPALGGSFLIAELFYKFGSFGLEALAFLGTWLVLDALIQTLSGVISRVESRTARPATVGGADSTEYGPRLSADPTQGADMGQSGREAGSGEASRRPDTGER